MPSRGGGGGSRLTLGCGGWAARCRELTKEFTLLQPQRLKPGLLGTEETKAPLPPVTLHGRLTLSWPAAPGASAKWAEQSTPCSVS